jgi:hypothetical protein
MEKEMEKETKQAEKVVVEPEIMAPDLMEEMALAEVLPGMSLTAPPPVEEKCIIEDEVLLELYDEILQNCREDRKEVKDLAGTFADMVVNDGEASSATKEALVNLHKIKTDISDKMSKVADLMTRIKLKDKDTFPRYLAAHQHNQVTIEGSKRDVLKAIQNAQRKKKNEK